MSSLSPKDRVSLCLFTYADGRRCRTPRISNHPHFCFDHAEKESRAGTADKLAKDVAAFFSGHYVSANDLSAAMARLIPAVVRGDIKPRIARTVAYMAQTLLQSIHLAQSEFKDALGQDNYRRSIRSGITSNHNRLFPPAPVPNPVPAPNAAPESVAAKSASPTPPPTPIAPQRPPTPTPSVCHPTLLPPCHPTPLSACHPEQSEGSLPVPAAPTIAETRSAPTTQPVPPSPQPATQTPSPTTPPPANPKRRPDSPHRDPYAIHFDHNHRLIEPEKAY